MVRRAGHQTTEQASASPTAFETCPENVHSSDTFNFEAVQPTKKRINGGVLRKRKAKSFLRTKRVVRIVKGSLKQQLGTGTSSK
jgi:hypothetical protein